MSSLLQQVRLPNLWRLREVYLSKANWALSWIDPITHLLKSLCRRQGRATKATISSSFNRRLNQVPHWTPRDSRRHQKSESKSREWSKSASPQLLTFKPTLMRNRYILRHLWVRIPFNGLAWKTSNQAWCRFANNKHETVQNRWARLKPRPLQQRNKLSHLPPRQASSQIFPYNLIVKRTTSKWWSTTRDWQQVSITLLDPTLSHKRSWAAHKDFQCEIRRMVWAASCAPG